MSNYIRYLFKTVRKFFGEAVVVTQEVEDIISSPIVKGTIINNSDCKILLDQRKYMNKFDEIQTLLGLTDKERAQILSINMANNPSRKYKEVWIGLGGSQSAVYATEAMQRSHKRIASTFPISRVYQAHIPTFAAGYWLFGFASKKYHPIDDLDAAAWKITKCNNRF